MTGCWFEFVNRGPDISPHSLLESAFASGKRNSERTCLSRRERRLTVWASPGALGTLPTHLLIVSVLVPSVHFPSFFPAPLLLPLPTLPPPNPLLPASKRRWWQCEGPHPRCSSRWRTTTQRLALSRPRGPSPGLPAGGDACGDELLAPAHLREAVRHAPPPHLLPGKQENQGGAGSLGRWRWRWEWRSRCWGRCRGCWRWGLAVQESAGVGEGRGAGRQGRGEGRGVGRGGGYWGRPTSCERNQSACVSPARSRSHGCWEAGSQRARGKSASHRSC